MNFSAFMWRRCGIQVKVYHFPQQLWAGGHPRPAGRCAGCTPLPPKRQPPPPPDPPAGTGPPPGERRRSPERSPVGFGVPVPSREAARDPARCLALLGEWVATHFCSQPVGCDRFRKFRAQVGFARLLCRKLPAAWNPLLCAWSGRKRAGRCEVE